MKIYTPEEAAQILKLNGQTIRRFLREGRLKGSKIGRTWRITEEQIKEFLDREIPKGETS